MTKAASSSTGFVQKGELIRGALGISKPRVMTEELLTQLAEARVKSPLFGAAAAKSRVHTSETSTRSPTCGVATGAFLMPKDQAKMRPSSAYACQKGEGEKNLPLPGLYFC
jgi:hypothetical protein